MINEIENLLINTILDSLKENGYAINFDEFKVNIEIPKDNKNGDYSTNVAMQLTRILRKNPQLIAKEIIEKIDKEKSNIEEIQIAGPGFINIFMKKGTLGTIINKVIEQDENYGRSNSAEGKSIDVEFVSANPTGDLHLGHARQAALGDSICRLLDAAGYKVTREYYINDAGNQIHNLALSLKARYYELLGRDDFALPEDGYHGEDVKNIAKTLIEEVGDKYLDKEDEETYWFFRNYGKDKELEKLKKDLNDFRVTFDVWSSEIKVREDGFIEKALSILKEKGYIYENEGATWFRSTAFGDDKDRVVIKSDGSYTYLTPDIAYHVNKLERGYDYLVDILGADHHGYIARLKATIQALGYEQDKLSVELVQMVRLIKDGAEFKMSKRTGNAMTIKELCQEVGTDSVRYFFVARSASSHLDFDMDLAIKSSSDNPVYYAQYAHARTCQVLELSKKHEFKEATTFELLSNPKEIDLIKYIGEFPSVVSDAAKTFSPYKITNYVQKLAQLFHTFYNECKVIDSTNEELSSQRLALVKASKIVIRNALNLVGVSAPNKM